MQCLCPVSRNQCLADRLLTWNGRPLNSAAIGRSLGVSAPTAIRHVRELEREGFLRLVPFFGGRGKPLLYLRNAHVGFRVELIITGVLQVAPGARFSWWKTGRVRRIDLIVETGGKRTGFCMSETRAPQNKGGRPLIIACRRGVICRGFYLHRGMGATVLGPGVNSLPFDAFVCEMEEWMLRRCTAAEARAGRVRINRRAAAALASFFRLDSAARAPL